MFYLIIHLLLAKIAEYADRSVIIKVSSISITIFMRNMSMNVHNHKVTHLQSINDFKYILGS
jgi:hypothetical protein